MAIGFGSSIDEDFQQMETVNKNNKKEQRMTLLEKLMKSGSDLVKASILSESDFFTDRAETVTDIPALNIALGGSVASGLQAGLTMVSGASKSFKTCISLYMVAAYMKKYKDAICVFYDSEFGSTPAYFKNFGIDIDRVLHIPVEHIEQLKFDMVNRLKDVKKKEHVIVFVDSVGNIASKKEVEDALEEKGAADMTRAKQLKSLWRITTPMFTMRDIPCIAINHIYMEQGMYPKAIVSGGTGGIYSSNTIWIITKSQEKDGTDLVGFTFTINIEKSRTVIEKSKIPLTVTFDGGINKFSGILDLALESGHVMKPSNGWYQLVNKTTGELIGGKVRYDSTQSDNFLGTVLNDQSFVKFVKDKYQLNSKLLTVSETTPSIPLDEELVELDEEDMKLVSITGE
jgi:RecA/RadA recombinase